MTAPSRSRTGTGAALRLLIALFCVIGVLAAAAPALAKPVPIADLGDPDTTQGSQPGGGAGKAASMTASRSTGTYSSGTQLIVYSRTLGGWIRLHWGMLRLFSWL